MASSLIAVCAFLDAANAQSPMSKEECRAASTCELVGTFTRSSDGHAWIGRLTLDSGDCVNVSIPDEDMERLGDSGVDNARIAGLVVLYPLFETDLVVITFALHGREIGIGACGDFFVFVESSDDHMIE